MALSILAARKTLALVAATMHVPAVHATLLEQQGLLQPPTTPALIMVRTCMSQYVTLEGLKRGRESAYPGQV